MAGTNGLTDTDKGWKSLKKTLKSFKDDELVIGIPGPIDFNIPTQAAIGTVHEFGSVDGTIPPRSFLRSTFDKNVRQYSRILTKNIRLAVEAGAPRKRGLFVLGETIRKDIIDRIKTEDIKQDLKESTEFALIPGTRVERGLETALMVTGTMVGQIVSIVRPRRG